MIINGVFLLLIVGVWCSYKLACWAGEPAREQTTNHEIRRHDA